MNYESESDMKAATMLGLNPQYVNSTWREDGEVKHGKAIFTDYGEFTLSNPVACNATVRALGAKEISIRSSDSGKSFAYYDERKHLWGSSHPKHKQAVRAAVIYCSEDEQKTTPPILRFKQPINFGRSSANDKTIQRAQQKHTQSPKSGGDSLISGR